MDAIDMDDALWMKVEGVQRWSDPSFALEYLLLMDHARGKSSPPSIAFAMSYVCSLG